MTSWLRSRVLAPQIQPEVAAVFFLLLAIVPEAKWRLRDPGASAAAAADLQTLLELGIYAAIGAWAMWHAIRGWTSGRYRLADISAAGLVLIFATLLIAVTGALSGSSRALTRSVQYVLMVTMTLVIWWEVRSHLDFVSTFWRIVRRGFVLFAVFATALTAVVPSFDGSLDERGIKRYGWMEIHPIATAGMLGVALLAITGAILGLPDRLTLHRWLRMGMVGLSAVFSGLLILTNSRGATIAVVLAVVAMIVATPRRRLRRFATLGLLVVVGLALVYFGTDDGSSQLQSFVNRGQTTEQVLSLSQRTTLLEIGMDYFAEKPVFGHGYMIPGTLLRTHFWWAGHAHNVALEILIGLGLIGIGVFLGLVIIIIRGIWQGARSSTGRATGIPAEAAALITLILVQGVVSDGFAGPVGWEVAVLMLTTLFSDLGRQWYQTPEVIEKPGASQLEDARGTRRSEIPKGSLADGDGMRRASHDGERQRGEGQVDLNAATAEELIALPGIGPRLAERIIAHRASLGGYVSTEQLMDVRGIHRIKYAKLRPFAVVRHSGHDRLRQRRWGF